MLPQVLEGRHWSTSFKPSLCAVLGLMALILLGCGSTLQSSAERSPTAVAPTQPTAEEITSALRFRTAFGLRADDAWIRAVFIDPASDRTFGVPLLPSEVAAVMKAQSAANAVSDIVAAYGATVPDDWVGMYVDQKAGGTVVARFKANVEAHRAALLALLPAGAKFDVHSAKWSEAELREFIAGVEQERDWFPSIGTKLFTAEIAGLDNLGGIDVRFDGPMAAAAQIEAHFGNPPWLRAVWNGPGEWAGARGDLEIYTTDSSGRPLSVDIDLSPVFPFQVEDDDIGWRTDDRGHLLRTNLPAIAYHVRAFEGTGDDRRLVAEDQVTVLANARNIIRLVVK